MKYIGGMEESICPGQSLAAEMGGMEERVLPAEGVLVLASG
jgi:hypothetical protein